MAECQLDQKIKEDLHGFEDFLSNLGFKRLEGSIYGLLVLVEEQLSAEEIQTYLDLSQSAVSNALRNLSSFNAITMSKSRERGCRLYQANEDCLNIVSNVFRKREQNILRDYKLSIKRLKSKALEEGESEDSLKVKRFNSILSVSEIGEAILKFIFTLDEMDLKHKKNLEKITTKLPKIFDLAIHGQEMASERVNIIRDALGEKMKGTFERMTGESREY